MCNNNNMMPSPPNLVMQTILMLIQMPLLIIYQTPSHAKIQILIPSTNTSIRTYTRTNKTTKDQIAEPVTRPWIDQRITISNGSNLLSQAKSNTVRCRKIQKYAGVQPPKAPSKPAPQPASSVSQGVRFYRTLRWCCGRARPRNAAKSGLL